MENEKNLYVFEANKCGFCCEEVVVQTCILCEKCKRPFHFECSKISESDFVFFVTKADPYALWKCFQCIHHENPESINAQGYRYCSNSEWCKLFPKILEEEQISLISRPITRSFLSFLTKIRQPL